MTITEDILKHLGKLPKSSQAEVLDFVEYLELKARNRGEKANWADFSLAAAMAGMEDEEFPYSSGDIKEAFK
jgi:hypothetical protein